MKNFQLFKNLKMISLCGSKNKVSEIKATWVRPLKDWGDSQKWSDTFCLILCLLIFFWTVLTWAGRWRGFYEPVGSHCRSRRWPLKYNDIFLRNNRKSWSQQSQRHVDNFCYHLFNQVLWDSRKLYLPKTKIFYRNQ